MEQELAGCHFALKALGFIAAAELISAVVMNLDTSTAVWQDLGKVAVSSAAYCVIFALMSMSFVWLCCSAAGKEIVYCGALSLCVQHFPLRFCSCCKASCLTPGLRARFFCGCPHC